MKKVQKHVKYYNEINKFGSCFSSYFQRFVIENEEL